MAEGGQKFNIKKVITHPKYDGNTVDYDVSVVVIDGVFNPNANMVPIRLSDKKLSEVIGQEAIVTGWGRTSVFTICTYIHNFIFKTNFCDKVFRNNLTPITKSVFTNI